MGYAREQQREQHMQSSHSMTEQDTSRHGMKSYNRRAGDAVGGKVGLRMKVLEVQTEESAFYGEDSGVWLVALMQGRDEGGHVYVFEDHPAQVYGTRNPPSAGQSGGRERD